MLLLYVYNFKADPLVLENQWGRGFPVEDDFSHFQLSLVTEAIMIPEGAMQASEGGKHPVLSTMPTTAMARMAQ